jgi:O-methyltransferase
VTAHPSTALYLDLMAKVITRYGFEGHHVTVMPDLHSYEYYLWELVRQAMPGRDIRLVETGEFRADQREEGRDWPVDAESMAGLKRLANTRYCVETALEDGVPGDLIETGVWRGGSCIYMRAVLKAHGVTDRTVWVADSFRGLPPPTKEHGADVGSDFHKYDELAISVDEVKDNFRRYDLLDDRVRFLEGWFSETLATAPIEQLAVLRLDGDMYSSTIDALDALYDKVSDGGFIIVDDYGAIPACAKAVHDFRDRRSITDPIEEVDWTGAFWRKGGPS